MSAGADTGAPGAVLVVGATGGCGTSLLAGALALAAQQARGGAWLLELDLGRGDLADAWDLPGDRTIDDLTGVSDELADHHLRAAAQVHPSGLLVLVAPRGPASGAWGPGASARLVGVAAAAAPGGCVVDGGCGLGPVAEGAAAPAGRVLVVCAPRIAAARRARCLLTRLAAAAPGVGAALVVASGPGRPEIGSRALGRAVGAPVAAHLPWSEREAAALSAGRWPGRRRRGLAAAVVALAEAA